MVILSASPHRCFAPKARVSSSPSSSSSCSHLKSVFVTCTFAVPSTVRRWRWRWRCAVSYCSSEFKGMAEMVKDKESAAAADMAVFGSESDDRELSHCRTFLDARTEQELISGIRKEMESGSLPLNVARAMEELYQTYRNAVIRSGNPKAEEVVLSNMAAAFDRIFMDVKDPFVFSPYHKAVREPFDYYLFVQNYIRPLIDFRNSYVGNIPLFYEIEQKLQQGENVVFVSNHQTEADPAVIALLLETTNPNLAENMTFVAGDRVITDPLCKPFSIGRNLLCVYSKNHLYDVPELAESKKKANTRSLKEMALLLRGGSKIIWIAPSGGRDRPDPVTNEWLPAPFDASAVDNMRRLVQHAGVPGHIYPLAILCHDIMPPPPQVEKEIGERRVICFHGTGISVAPKISFDEITATCEDPAEAKVAYTEALYESVNSQYDVLKSAVHRKQGLEASTPTVSLSQPWI